MSATVVLSRNFISSLRERKILIFLSHYIPILQSLIKSTFILQNERIHPYAFLMAYIGMHFWWRNKPLNGLTFRRTDTYPSIPWERTICMQREMYLQNGLAVDNRSCTDIANVTSFAGNFERTLILSRSIQARKRKGKFHGNAVIILM